MKLPATLQHTQHKHGGRIVRIERIGHETAKPAHGRSRDVWFFIGDVDWHDGTTSKGLEIAPYALCYDGEHARSEIDALLKLLNDYLAEHGDWYQKGKHQGWYARRRH